MTVRPTGETGEAWVPGTCGELLQGTLEGQDFLVTAPINRFSRAWVTVGQQKLAGPVGAKSLAGLDAVRRRLQVPEDLPLGLELESNLPRGKGMASSTADITAVAAAAFRAFQQEPSPEELAGLAAGLEPTDGVMFPGIVAVDHRLGKLLASLGTPPPLSLLIYDTGGHVESLAFNHRPDLARANRKKEPALKEAWEILFAALRDQDGEALAYAATTSALAHEAILPKPGLALYLREVQATGGFGLCVAHSGTVIGLFYPPEATADPTLPTFLSARLPGAFLGRASLIGGGIRGPRVPTRPRG